MCQGDRVPVLLGEADRTGHSALSSLAAKSHPWPHVMMAVENGELSWNS